MYEKAIMDKGDLRPNELHISYLHSFKRNSFFQKLGLYYNRNSNIV